MTVSGLPEPVVLGEDFTLTCNATGDEPIDYVWTRESDMVMTNGTKLMVASATAADIGFYQCNATNLFGEDSATVTVVEARTLTSCTLSNNYRRGHE